ncbi:hypothetical protein Btru_033547 [Bulinus truncatus]|nr:hypothetical protein Btru_033547 [Bulinus truncatus]
MTKAVGFLTTLLLMILYNSSLTESTCSNGWFGDYCQYKCHCKNNPCNSNGSCKGAGCESGWFGYKCQYRNLITQDNNWLTDENDDTCNGDKSIDTVSLTLNRDNIFTWLKLIFNASEPIRVVSLQFTTLVSAVDCPNQRIIQTDNRTLLVWCSLNVTVNQVNITGEGVKSLCSVYVSGGRNVALKQPTVQTSTYTDTEKSKSMNAVDGNTSGNFDDKSCTHTAAGDTSPTWTVEFNETLMINKFVLYNRKSVENKRLIGFRLQAFNKDSILIMNYTDKETEAQDIYYVNYFLNVPTHAVNITAFYYFSGVYLTLCEVEIFGDCPGGKKGLECNDTCGEKCPNNCNGDVNTCNYVCFGNSDPPTCQTDCPAGRWGLNCANNCTGQCWSSNCDSKSGLCLTGCLGFMDPPYCTQVCSGNRWGLNCSQTCSSHCQNNACNRLNGECQFGCIPGYFGSDCTNECQTGYWGTGCKEQCNTHCVQGNCSKETGMCLEGCMGYSDPPTCKNACTSGKYGINCGKNCSTNCVNMTCMKDDGACIQCVKGYAGHYCENTVQENGDTPNLGAIVGAVIGVVLILGLAVLTFFLCRRHVGAKGKTERPIKMTFDQESSSPSKRNADKDVTDISNINDSKLMEDETNQGSDYYNSIQTGDEDRIISVSYLNMFMATHKKPFFIEQFKMIPSAVGVSMENANNEQNKNKNRYKNICTYDHSRVNLNINTIKNEGDYINASYIKDFGDKVEFIASQGPNKIILNDFVRMLWEQNTEKIVMLTNLAEEGKTKCEQYWPDEGKIKFGDVKVKLLTTTSFSDFTIRRLEFSKKNDETHHITHYQYHAWPDKGVPPAPWSLIDFVYKVTASTSPHLTVVHCSAGVGRTGTFIALLNVIKQAAETGKLNFFETVTKLRQDRIFMVQTATQYEFLHKAAQTALLCLNSTLTLDELKNKMDKIKQKKNALKIDWIESEWKHLCDVCSNVNTEDTANAIDEDDNVYQNTQKPSQQEKNRFPDIVPKPMDRPFLHVAKEATDDYINAVFVQGIKQKDRYILNQLPMHQTVDDFWRLVTQYKINTIVAFEMGEMSKDKTIAQYLPTEKTQVFKTSMFEITSNSCKQTLFWDDQRLTVTCNSDTKCEKQEVICITTLFKDLNVKKWLSLSSHLQASNTTLGKIVFLCRNGAQYSGLACVLNLLLETLDIHLRVNVPLVVGTVKSIRPEVVPTLDQYRLIYDVLESFHESSAQYTSVGDKLLKEIL